MLRVSSPQAFSSQWVSYVIRCRLRAVACCPHRNRLQNYIFIFVLPKFPPLIFPLTAFFFKFPPFYGCVARGFFFFSPQITRIHTDFFSFWHADFADDADSFWRQLWQFLFPQIPRIHTDFSFSHADFADYADFFYYDNFEILAYTHMNNCSNCHNCRQKNLRNLRNLRDKKRKNLREHRQIPKWNRAKFPNEIAPNSQMTTEKFG